jgi:streptomycin 6-kinase
MPSIVDWLRDRLEDDHLTELPPGATIAAAEKRCTALNVLDELAYGVTPGLCHGDASTWNILASGQTGWKLIDPRGMSGEPAYDVAVLGSKVARHVPAHDIAPVLASAADVDPERVRAWMLVADAERV